MRIIQFFIERTFLVNLICGFIILIGLFSLFNLRRDLIPRWEEKSLQVSATLDGASPEEMERNVTYPIEEALRGFEGIEKIESRSSDSSTSITLLLKDGFDDIQGLRSKIQRTVDGLRGNLPDGIENLLVSNNGQDNVWFSSLSALGFNPNNESHLDWYRSFEERVLGLDGLVNVYNNIPRKELLLTLNEKAMAEKQIEMQTVLAKVEDHFRVRPVGVLDQGTKKINIRIKGQDQKPENVMNVILRGNASGSQILLKDIAKGTFGFPEEKNRSYTNGQKSFSIWTFKNYKSDIIKLKYAFEDLLAKEKKLLPPEIQLEVTGDGPSFILRQINALKSNGLFGIILVFITLFIFFGWKTSLLTSLSLPLAFFATLSTLYFSDIALDLLSIVGMIFIVGVLVDDAIIVAEQYMQFLEKGYKPKKAASEAVRVTIIPVTGTIITTIVAFSPILFSQSMLRDILFAIPIVVIAALGVSWFESFFILPNHLADFIKTTKVHKESHWLSNLKKNYSRVLETTLRFRYLLFLLIISFMSFSIWFAYKNIPMKFDLRINPERVRIQAELPQGYTLEQTEEKLQPIFEHLNKLPKEKYSYITSRIGNVWMNGKNLEEPHYASISVRFSQTDPNVQKNKAWVEKYLKETLTPFKTKDFSKLNIEIRKDGYDEERESTTNVYLKGKTYRSFDELSQTLETIVQGIPGYKEFFYDPQLTQNRWQFNYDENKLIPFNIDAFHLSSHLRVKMVGHTLRSIPYKGDWVPVKVEFQKNGDWKFGELPTTSILGRSGQLLQLDKVGKWTQDSSLSSLQHEDLKRSLSFDIKFDKDKVKKEIFNKDLEKQVMELAKKWPELTLSIADADKESTKNKKAMGKMIIACVVLILFVLAIILNSLIQPFIIWMAIPFGVIGVIWSFYFHNITIDIMAFIGILGMAGVVVNDSLIMMDKMNRLKKEGEDNKNSIIIGATSRLRPILLTSITTLGGVFPMAYALGGDAGFTKTLALSMGWGLLFATGLTLFLIPSLVGIYQDSQDLMSYLGRKLMPRKNFEYDEIHKESKDSPSSQGEESQNLRQ